MSIWSNIKKYVTKHPVRSAIIGTVLILGAAALITGIVFTGGALAAPVAAGGLAVALGGSTLGVGAAIASVGAVALGAGGMYLLADILKDKPVSTRRRIPNQQVVEHHESLSHISPKKESTAKTYIELKAVPSPAINVGATKTSQAIAQAGQNTTVVAPVKSSKTENETVTTPKIRS